MGRFCILSDEAGRKSKRIMIKVYDTKKRNIVREGAIEEIYLMKETVIVRLDNGITLWLHHTDIKRICNVKAESLRKGGISALARLWFWLKCSLTFTSIRQELRGWSINWRIDHRDYLSASDPRIIGVVGLIESSVRYWKEQLHSPSSFYNEIILKRTIKHLNELRKLKFKEIGWEQ